MTLVGPSGIGKTRLALEVACRVGAGYPGGAWLVDLAPVADPNLVPRAVAAALRLPPEPGLDPAEVLTTHLRSRRALLVLDNCEHVLEACAALTGTLLEAASEVTILATTQRALDVGGEEVVPVTPMSLPDRSTDLTAELALRSEAVSLFCARAEASGPASFAITDDVASAVVEICLRLEGIPLAIELAAARAAVLTPAEIAERLEDRFRLLTRGPDSAPRRHQTLSAALDWSYDLLSPGEAALLRRLSVFSGGATLRAVEEVCSGGEVNRADVLDLVSELVSRSLLTADTSGPRARYRMLETVRDYASQRLVESGELDARRTRHAEWCLALAERASHLLLANDEFWMATIDSELDNIRAGLEWAVTQEPKFGLRMAVAVAQVWKIRGHLSEGQSWLERALQANPDSPGSLRARALWSIGMLAVLQGDATTATQAVEQSLALARAGGLRRAEAQALNLLGFISIFTQDPLAAMPLLEESVGLARVAGERSLLVNALVLYGRAHLYLGAPGAARRVFEECLQLTGTDGDQADSSLVGLGWAASMSGELQRAEELFRQALSVLRRDAESFETAMVLSFLGELSWARGDMIEARALLDEGLALARDMGAPFPMVRCQATLARVALCEGDLATARSLADDSCTRASRFPLPYAHVRCLHVQGLVRL
ncbi:MAG: tetratricopeptide repeat protein, partial [Acidimicrobiales bacterium]